MIFVHVFVLPFFFGDSIYAFGAFGGRINPAGFHEKLTSDLWRLGGVAEAVAGGAPGGACTFDQ